MARHVCLSIRLLRPEFHGRGDGGTPEWPPSPLRAFQSLVAGAAARDRRISDVSQATLRWLEALNPPVIVAPAALVPARDAGYRLSVPNNSMDVVARAWSRGSAATTGDANPATHRTMKRVLPTRLEAAAPICFLWELPEPFLAEVESHVDRMGLMARAIVAFGWGLDHAIGSVEVLSDQNAGALEGERWLPGEVAESRGLRVPVPETLSDLMQRHERFLARVSADGVLTPPPPLSAFAVIAYRRSEDPVESSFGGFELRKPDALGFAVFDVTRRALTVAGMLRHTTSRLAAASGWPQAKIDEFVLGHGEESGSVIHEAVGARRFSYLPIPSLEFRGSERSVVVGAIRRALVACLSPSGRSETSWARRALAGQELVEAGTSRSVALLAPMAETDRALQRFTQGATEWATVTPVVLPGHDDRGGVRRRLRQRPPAEQQQRLLGKLSRRTDSLLRRALLQAGIPPLLAKLAELDWRAVGYLPGTDLASRYGVPDHLRHLPRLHVRIGWRDAAGQPVRVPGPLAIGGGRYYGLGLLVALP